MRPLTRSATPAAAKNPTNAADTRDSYGMSMRFRVMVHNGAGLTSQLGEWSGCSGLGLTVKLDEYNAGGSYAESHRFPERVGYNQVTLERAMESTSSAELQKWLRHVIDSWVTADEAGAADSPGHTVTITMLSTRKAKEIFTWTLHDAIPVGWSGPTLSAKGGDIAIEKLVLSCNGLTGAVPGTPGAAAAAQHRGGTGDTGGTGKMTLSLMSGGTGAPGANSVTFQYNPQKVTLSKTAKFQSGVTLSGDNIEKHLVEAEQLSLSISDLRIEGAGKVSTDVNKLFDWLSTSNAAPAAAGGDAQKTAAPPAAVPAAVPAAPANGTNPPDPKADPPKQELTRLRIEMGASLDQRTFRYVVALKAVSVTYLRFTSTGIPSRASVSLTMQQLPRQWEKATPAGAKPSAPARPPDDKLRVALAAHRRGAAPT